MQEQPSSSKPKPQKLTAAEFFGVPERALTAVETDIDRPDWYQDFLGNNALKQDFIVWYDAWDAIELFALVQSQWRQGFNGITGLDYTAVIAVIALYYPYPPEQRDMLNDIVALETGYMAAVAELRKKEDEKAERERNKT